jgi:hypothetical protein
MESARHLKGVSLQYLRYQSGAKSWDHDHCAACGAKFAELDEPGIQREGYTTCDDYKLGALYDWVCSDCFNDLRAAMGWKVAGGSSTV